MCHHCARLCLFLCLFLRLKKRENCVSEFLGLIFVLVSLVEERLLKFEGIEGILMLKYKKLKMLFQ